MHTRSPGLRRLDVRDLAPLSGGQLGSGLLRKPACGLGAVQVEHRHAPPAGLLAGHRDGVQPHAPQQPADRAGGDTQAAVYRTAELIGQVKRAPSGPSQSQGQDGPLGREVEQWRTPSARARLAGVQAIPAAGQEPPPPAVIHSTGDPGFPARPRKVVRLLRPCHAAQVKRGYAVFKGHERSSLLSNKKDTSLVALVQCVHLHETAQPGARTGATRTRARPTKARHLRVRIGFVGA